MFLKFAGLVPVLSDYVVVGDLVVLQFISLSNQITPSLEVYKAKSLTVTYPLSLHTLVASCSLTVYSDLFYCFAKRGIATFATLCGHYFQFFGQEDKNQRHLSQPETVVV